VTARHPSVILTSALTLALLLSACSPSTRYRVLSFFFDGVPEPGVPVVEGYGPGPTGQDESAPGRARAPRVPVFAHAPFRENRCTACHNLNTGQLTKEVRAGLCMDCHTPPAEDAPYLHGPVAINDCVACHHFHASPHPKLLLQDLQSICFRCHDREDLSAEPHDATIEGQACVVCHDPHGGAGRFFLK